MSAGGGAVGAWRERERREGVLRRAELTLTLFPGSSARVPNRSQRNPELKNSSALLCVGTLHCVCACEQSRARACVCVCVVCGCSSSYHRGHISLFYLTIPGCCTQLVSSACSASVPADRNARLTPR